MKNLFYFLTVFSILTLNSQNQPKKQAKIDSVTALDEVIINANTILGNKFVAKNKKKSALKILVLMFFLVVF